MLNLAESLCDAISNLIIATESPLIARAAYRAATLIDPTESNHAAHIRDTARDNLDNFPY